MRLGDSSIRTWCSDDMRRGRVSYLVGFIDVHRFIAKLQWVKSCSSNLYILALYSVHFWWDTHLIELIRRLTSSMQNSSLGDGELSIL